jgi:hypothetical protein
MVVEPQLSELRCELSDIIKNGVGNDETAWKKKLEELKKFNHSIIIEKSINNLDRFTCFEYAFELYNVKEYNDLKAKLCEKHFYNIFCNSSFVEWLDRNNKLISDVNGDLILYYNKIIGNLGDFTHAGIYTDNDLIISKWGDSFIFKHPIDEVPAEYGVPKDYFKKPTPEKVLEYFKDYLKELAKTIHGLNI